MMTLMSKNLNYTYKFICLEITDLGQEATFENLIININKDVYYLLHRH